MCKSGGGGVFSALSLGGGAFGDLSKKKSDKKTKKVEQQIESAKWDKPKTEQQSNQARAWAGQPSRAPLATGSSTLGGAPATSKPTLLGGG